ncbi:DNA repair helicase XPB [Alicyclobacillus shizuokensis]|uniref:DNA repair helicase XPB n=1 Tax=Alicyclobacillus shizuokensis TaxID=392014 RepID=UPI00082BBBCE|nr:DNA repair helicase XPB [Alicyclobacillus shizuokensis]
MSGFLYIHADGTVIARSDVSGYESVQAILGQFAELSQQLDPIHVYRLHPLSLWQAAARGLTTDEVLRFLRRHAVHPLPLSLQLTIQKEMSKWGQLELVMGEDGAYMMLHGAAGLLEELSRSAPLTHWAMNSTQRGIRFRPEQRADVKRALARLGYPVLDRAGYHMSSPLDISARDSLRLRDYQQEAVAAFFADGSGQSGIIVLPCGAGKTVVGIAILAQLKRHALILTPGEEAAGQWKRELQRWTEIAEEAVSIYDPRRRPSPVTITTYQRVAARSKTGLHRNLETLTRHPWGLVIYDEVHVLPAPLFRLAAELQGVRRLGLTATLVREDGLAADVFSLIGPKLYEAQWKPLERDGYLAPVTCVEIDVPWHSQDYERYRVAGIRERHRVASENRAKVAVVCELVQRHSEAKILIFGHYVESLSMISHAVGCPLITGRTPKTQREDLYESFREGRVRVLALSRVANMAIDLPAATVAIQVSGLFGSRQEEAQRLGRLLRPAGGSGMFYTLVTEQSVEQEKARHRQMFLVEQGYRYEKVHAGNVSWLEGVSIGALDGVPE